MFEFGCVHYNEDVGVDQEMMVRNTGSFLSR